MRWIATACGALCLALVGCDEGASGDEGSTAAARAAEEAQAAAREAQSAAAEARAQAEAAAEARAAAEVGVAAAAAPPGDEEPAGDEGMSNPLIECTSQANYNACIIRNLRDPATPREYEALINAYRESGERDRACQLMRDVIERYPTSPAARRFQQFVQRNCP